MNIVYYSLLISLVFFLTACEKTNALEQNEEVKAIYQEFLDTANDKGINLANRAVEIFFKDLNGPIGQCVNSKRIELDQDLWRKSSITQKQFTLFHELGHCLLDRSHKNEVFRGQQCKSLMKGTEDCFKCSFDFESENWKEYYIDELFEEELPPPEWLAFPNIEFDSTKNWTLNIHQSEFNNNVDTFLSGNKIIEEALIQFSIKDLDYSKFGATLSILTADNESINFQFSPFHAFSCQEFSLPRLAINDCHGITYKNYESYTQNVNTELTVYLSSENIYFYLNKQPIHVKKICSAQINNISLFLMEKNVSNFKEIKEHKIEYRISLI